MAFDIELELGEHGVVVIDQFEVGVDRAEQRGLNLEAL